MAIVFQTSKKTCEVLAVTSAKPGLLRFLACIVEVVRRIDNQHVELLNRKLIKQVGVDQRGLCLKLVSVFFKIDPGIRDCPLLNIGRCHNALFTQHQKA